MTVSELYMSVREVAALTGVSSRRVVALITSGALEARRDARWGYWLIPAAAAARLAAERQEAARLGRRPHYSRTITDAAAHLRETQE